MSKAIENMLREFSLAAQEGIANASKKTFAQNLAQARHNASSKIISQEPGEPLSRVPTSTLLVSNSTDSDGSAS